MFSSQSERTIHHGGEGLAAGASGTAHITSTVWKQRAVNVGTQLMLSLIQSKTTACGYCCQHTKGVFTVHCTVLETPSGIPRGVFYGYSKSYQVNNKKITIPVIAAGNGSQDSPVRLYKLWSVCTGQGLLQEMNPLMSLHSHYVSMPDQLYRMRNGEECELQRSGADRLATG